ncbi:putative late blight resistance protein homolog R1B-16 isoform X2 [Coffea arabica]|uniref:Late blight resistance protein homolog R1B-16 isoform X2 n=1 Tax=Coffea arabica TaxID=13443 RepID=A0ABM4WMK8_COFAR
MSKETNKHRLGNFVDALLDNFWELLNCNTGLMDSTTSQMHIVYEGLRFLRTILKNQHENFDKLPENVKDIIGDAVGEAKSVIHSLFMHDLKEDSTKDMDHVFFAFQKNIKLIEAEVGDRHYVSTIMAEVNLVNMEYVGIGDDEFTCGAQKKAQTPPRSWLQWTMPTSNQVVVGFHDEAGQIIFQLTGGSGELDVVSIVGMPGLGKTTLGNKVYQDPMIICHFHIRAWCCISQVYGKKDVLFQILACIDPLDSDEYSRMDADDLAIAPTIV